MKGTVRASTHDGHRVYVEKHLKPGLGRHRLAALRPDDIDRRPAGQRIREPRRQRRLPLALDARPADLARATGRGRLVQPGVEAQAGHDGDRASPGADLAAMDARGYCRIEGRLKDMIIRGGENIYPREIEAVLSAHPAVGDAAVVGVPDETWGEAVAAFVRPAPGQAPAADELFAYCRAHLAPYKTPRHWRFVEQFPQTPSGKIQKFILRERFVREQRDAG